MHGVASAVTALFVMSTMSMPLPPPREQPDGGGTLQLLTPGDPLALAGQADGASYGVGRQLSGDGQLAAFRTEAGNLAGRELSIWIGGVVATPGSGVVRRIDALAQDQTMTSELRTPVVSRDGSTVAYTIYVRSAPIGLVRLFSDVYVVDLATGVRTRVTGDPTNVSAMGWSLNPSISADGNFVAFDSLNAFVADDPGLHDVYLWSRANNAFLQVSRAADGTAANGPSSAPSISDDGNRIAFVSSATNLVAGGVAGQGSQIFLHDRASGLTRLVSRTASGVPGNASSLSPGLSPDGRFVVFLSDASNLVPGDSNEVTDAYLFDTQTDVVSRVSIGPGGVQPNAPVQSVSVCDAGRRVVFGSAASNLDPMGSGSGRKVFLREIATSQVRVLGRPASGGAVTGTYGFAVLAPDCDSTVYPTAETGLGPPDDNGLSDVFHENLDTGSVVALSRWTGSPPATALMGEATAGSSSISADGQRILVDYAAKNMFPGDDLSMYRSVLIDRATGTRTRIDGPILSGVERPRRQSALAAVAPMNAYAVSIAGDTSPLLPIYLRRPGTPTDIAITPPGVPEADFSGNQPRISATGSRALFSSGRPVSFDGSMRIYFSTVGSGVVDTISAPPNQSIGSSPSLAAGGDFATYITSEAITPDDDDINGKDVYRVDLRTRAHLLVTPEVPDGASVYATAISGDGNKVAYVTDAPVAAPQLPECPGRVRSARVLVRDIASGQTRCGSLNAQDPALPDQEYSVDSVSISPNGRWLAYRASAVQNGGIIRIFVTDLDNATTYVANRSAGPTEVFSSVSVPAVSDQGQVVFWTAWSLVPDDVGRGNNDVYLYQPPGVSVFTNGFEGP